MYAVALLAVVVTMSLALVRASRGPTVFDRILALNMIGTKTVLLISIVSFFIGRTDFLDLALLYSLMNFIGIVAVLRFSKYGTFDDSQQFAP
jgi:multicomponent Na+:H+ antiporter subunit F